MTDSNDADKRKRIVVFGAAGGTGTQVIDAALAAGYEVVAAVRRPDAVVAREGVSVVQADVLDPSSVASAVVGADAVISAIGPASNRKAGSLISQGTHNILTACAAAGVQRLVFESGMICSDGKELSALGSFQSRVFGLVYPGLKTDKLLAEAEITNASLDWVIVRPGALKHAPATGMYIAGPKARILPAKSLSHADCAAVLVRAVAEPSWSRQVINVSRG